MRKEFENALKNSTPIKVNEFETPLGRYGLKIVLGEDNRIYLFKYKNGHIVECMDISKAVEDAMAEKIYKGEFYI